MNTEQKLINLFDYQRFEQNEKLEKLIRKTESRYATELLDDDLSLVNAAGETLGGNIGWGKDQQGKILLSPDKK